MQMQVTDTKLQCWRCGRLLAEFVSRPWRIRCPRCKAVNNPPQGDVDQVGED